MVPRYLEERDGDDGDEVDEAQGSYPSVVVCSGELVEQARGIYSMLRSLLIDLIDL